MAQIQVYLNIENGDIITYSASSDLTKFHHQLLLLLVIEGWNLASVIKSPDYAYKWTDYKKMMKKKPK